MTSASELFCSRRTRFGRGSADPELESGPDLSHHQQSNRRSGFHGHRSSRRQGFDSCLPLRRDSQSRMPGYRTTFTEREPFEVNEGTNQFDSANDVIAGVTCDERLPGAVLQARERLMQRLRGAAVSDRRCRRPPPNVSQSNNTSNDDFRLIDAVDWETEIFLEFSPRRSSSATSIFHSELHPLFPFHCKKPLGLAPDAINCLPIEIFNECGQATDDDLVSWDCSICLERFSIGNEFARLPCSHRFHLACLSQWVQICGDCPCCRSSIV